MKLIILKFLISAFLCPLVLFPVDVLGVAFEARDSGSFFEFSSFGLDFFQDFGNLFRLQFRNGQDGLAIHFQVRIWRGSRFQIDMEAKVRSGVQECLLLSSISKSHNSCPGVVIVYEFRLLGEQPPQGLFLTIF